MFQDENILNSVMMFDTVLWDESIDTSENNTVTNWKAPGECKPTSGPISVGHSDNTFLTQFARLTQEHKNTQSKMKKKKLVENYL